MNTPRPPPIRRPSRLLTGLIPLGAGLAAVLAVSGGHAFHQVVLGEGLGLAVPGLVVRIVSALLGTAAAALAAVLAFRLADGPVPRYDKTASRPPSVGKRFPRWKEPGKEKSNGNGAVYSHGKEELPWT